MSERMRWVSAGAVMAVMCSAMLDLLDKDWRYAAWLLLGFISGVFWWQCVAPEWEAMKRGDARHAASQPACDELAANSGHVAKRRGAK